jgi:uncharacterized protein
VKIYFLFLSLAFSMATWGQCDSVATIQWQKDLALFYLGDQSPLPATEKSTFPGVSFFPYQSEACVLATFSGKKKQPFVFSTSSGKQKTYYYIGDLHWEFQGKTHQLPLFEGGDPNQKWFFLPFSDPTNGEETYGGGRYVDLPWKKIKTGQKLTLDFNRAYFPYCAYTSGYACPLVPDMSRLTMPVLAGVKWPETPK